MKKTIKFLCGALVAIALVTTSCKKDPGPKGDTGAQGPQGIPGPSAKTYTFAANFSSTSQYYSYSGLIGLYTADDAILVYVMNATYSAVDYYVQLPYVVGGSVNVYAEVGETGIIFINTDKANGTSGSPWTSNVSFKFKAVVIKSSQLKKHPDINLKDYNEVVQTFNIKD